jgi:hypothetical protein
VRKKEVSNFPVFWQNGVCQDFAPPKLQRLLTAGKRQQEDETM